MFKACDSLRQLTEAVERHPLSIIGLYGASHGKQRVIDGMREVQTLDECCVAMKRSTWERFKFNEELCDGWHLYVVELCLRAKKDGAFIGAGKFDIQHLSMGCVDERYMKTFKGLLVQYKDYGYIATTCKSMPTSLIMYQAYYLVWRFKKVLFGNARIIYRLKKSLGI